MSTAVRTVSPDRHAGGRVREANRVLGIVLLLAAASVVISLSCLAIFGLPERQDRLQFPGAFVVSSVLLLLGSASMNRAVANVQAERQRDFRRWLMWAAAIASLFMGIQSYGLMAMPSLTDSPEQTSLAVRPFVMVLAGLHAMHFSVATLCISVVLARSIADRYDHEYHWGVTVCAWFWHVLGIAWMAILAVFAIAFGS
jgi:heme/copper-type cytochrome/quinol oxidase subunit 3